MRILVTGVTGFVGGHLAESLLAAGGAEVCGIARRRDWPAEWRHLAANVVLHAADLVDSECVESVLRTVAPNQIYHLAGYAQTGQSFREPDAAWAGNLTGTRSLYDAVIRWGGKPRIVFVSSGLIYSMSEHPGQPVNEETPFRPVSPYAASKAAADLLSYQMTRHPGLEIVTVRPFNQIGPRQSSQFAVGSFARQLARIERGLDEPRLETGDLSAKRDLTDVRDMVEAYRAAMESGESGEAYNAGTGTAVSMQEVVDGLCALCLKRVEVVTKTERLRPADAAVVVADATKLRTATGWEPRYSLRQTLCDTLDYWRGATASDM
ncbi:MAG: GDP-mannose 4,6-dehydratase [Gemmataceae bacterium]